MTDDPPLAKMFAELVTGERLPMVRWAERWLGADGEDCFQEACARAWRYWPPAEMTDRRAWLWQILRRMAIDWHRRRSRTQRLQRDRPLPVGGLAMSPAVFEALDSMARQLSPTEYAALWAYAVEGYSHAEITQRMGLAYMTSMSRVHRARQRLMQ